MKKAYVIMSKILLFFLSLFCLGTVILIPLGIIGLWYFARPSTPKKPRQYKMEEYEAERFI
jgi:hypothetical protein